MFILRNPVTGALVEIRTEDLHAKAIFINLVLDGYDPVGLHCAIMAERVIDLAIEHEEKSRVGSN